MKKRGVRTKVKAVQVPPAVTAPPERWRHGQVALAPPGPRMPQSVSSGVVLLRQAGRIEVAEVVAAERFVRDYVFGVEGVRDPVQVAGGGGGADACHAVQLARAAALGRHREVSETIGSGMTQWVVAFLVMDCSFSAMTERFLPGAGRDEMKGRMTTLLMLLARLYVLIDRRVAPSSRLRFAPPLM